MSQKRGRPTPSTVRFAHRSRRGKPAQPAPLDAAPAPAAPSVVTMHDLTRFPAPAGLGRWGYAPHCVTAGLGAGCHSATVFDLPAAALRLPPPFSGLRGADALPGAAGRGALAPLPACGRAWLPYVARLTPSDCAPMACYRYGTDCCQTVRVIAAWLPRRPASAQGRRLPPPESVAHSFGDLHPGRPGSKGRWHRVRSFIRSLRAAASVAPLLSGLPAWVSISPRAMNSGSTAESKCSPHAKPEMA